MFKFFTEVDMGEGRRAIIRTKFGSLAMWTARIFLSFILISMIGITTWKAKTWQTISIAIAVSLGVGFTRLLSAKRSGTSRAQWWIILIGEITTSLWLRLTLPPKVEMLATGLSITPGANLHPLIIFIPSLMALVFNLVACLACLVNIETWALMGEGGMAVKQQQRPWEAVVLWMLMKSWVLITFNTLNEVQIFNLALSLIQKISISP